MPSTTLPRTSTTIHSLPLVLDALLIMESLMPPELLLSVLSITPQSLTLVLQLMMISSPS